MTAKLSNIQFHIVPKTGNREDPFEGSFSQNSSLNKFCISGGHPDYPLTREWSESLARSFPHSDYPVENSHKLLVSFLNEARGLWLKSVAWCNLKWYVRNKAIKGSYASFAGVSVSEVTGGYLLRGFTSNYGGIFIFSSDGSVKCQEKSRDGDLKPYFWSGYSPPIKNEYHWDYQGSFYYEKQLRPGDAVLLATPGISDFIYRENLSPVIDILRVKDPGNNVGRLMKRGDIENQDNILAVIRIR